MPSDLLKFLPYLAAFVAGVIFAWEIQATRLDALDEAFTEYRLTAERNAAMAESVKTAQELQWQKEKENAERDARSRLEKAETERAALARVADGLRRDVSSLRARLADAPRAACLDAADTLGELFEECAGAYRDMAEKAERHAGDVRTLREAWPSSAQHP